MSLQGKTALVTGASSGVGYSIAEQLVTAGANVLGLCRNTSAVPDKVTAIACDLSDTTQIDAAFAEIPSLDILVNNAAHVGMGMIADTELEGFQQNFRVNMDAPYMGTRAAMAAMRETGGSIINISSVNGDRAMQGMSGYGASKAALTHFTRNAAMEGARQGIRINAVTPGPIMTPATQAWFNADPDAGAAIANANPMGRIGTPEEVANVVCFLASDEASYVTGANIPVDGGKANEVYVPS